MKIGMAFMDMEGDLNLLFDFTSTWFLAGWLGYTFYDTFDDTIHAYDTFLFL